MGNTTTKNIGDFQQGVGEASADINLVGSYIFAGIAIIIAIVFIVLAFVPEKTFSSNAPCGQNQAFGCAPTEECDPSTNTCKLKNTNSNSRRYGLLIVAVLLIIIGIGAIFISRITDKAVHKNRSFAEAYGTFSEANMVSNILNR